LIQQLGETLIGMTTIRAYGEEIRFIRENLAKIDSQSQPFIYLWVCHRWLNFRLNMLGALVIFFAGVFAILSLGRIDASAVGISLSYAIAFAINMHFLVRQYAQNDQNMNSVERIKEYLDTAPEADAIVENNRPPASWPNKGEVEFVNYSTRYRDELGQVLKGLTFKIDPGQKVGIVGRTGAGKSSLALAIFRALEADEGKILIDGIEIGKIGLQDLRQAITFVPQDPALFMGTLRSNMDPFQKHKDEEIFAALRTVHLIGPNEPAEGAEIAEPAPSTATTSDAPAIEVTQPGEETSTQPSSPTLATNKNIFLDLSYPIAKSGNNLSQGQRQLVCLARAMLCNPSVLVMDEAIASIDYATDSRIHETIRKLSGTNITITHRLQTIIDYDRVLVLDKGKVVEYDHPRELIQKENGIFRGMCESSGEFDSLYRSAHKVGLATS
jgi:ABC-type multidrug transport system fused ATPase/permease subunit